MFPIRCYAGSGWSCACQMTGLLPGGLSNLELCPGGHSSGSSLLLAKRSQCWGCVLILTICTVWEEFLILLPIGHSLGHVTTHVVVGRLVQLVRVANVDVGGGDRGPLVQWLLVAIASDTYCWTSPSRGCWSHGDDFCHFVRLQVAGVLLIGPRVLKHVVLRTVPW